MPYPTFGIASPTALKRYDADEGEASPERDLTTRWERTAPLTQPGPGRSCSSRGGGAKRWSWYEIPHYWGPKAKLDRLVFRTIPDRQTRLDALERGTIDGLDAIPTGAVDVIKRNQKLKLLNRAVGKRRLRRHQPVDTADEQAARQAGSRLRPRSRSGRARGFYGGRGRLAEPVPAPQSSSATPSTLQQYRYDPKRSRALLRKAGLQLPVKVDFWYPTDTTRPYMPDPKRNFDAFAAGLARAGFKVVPHSARWDP